MKPPKSIFAGDVNGMPKGKVKIKLKRNNQNARMIQSMAAVPIKEVDSDEEAPTDRIAGVKKFLDGRMKK